MKLLTTGLCLLMCFTAMIHRAEAGIYTLSWNKGHTHTYQITFRTPQAEGAFTDVKLAVWRPGRYIRQDFAAGVSKFTASSLTGKKLKWVKVNPHTWRVYHSEAGDLQLSYQYYANNVDAGSSYLSDGEAYFNPINLFMYVQEYIEDPVVLKVPKLNPKWKIASALPFNQELKQFRASSYHELVDSPTVMAENIKTLKFELRGKTFFLHFQGEFIGGQSVENSLRQNISAICDEAGEIFGEFPFEEFHFIYRLIPYNIRHAVEHANSVSFALPFTVTESPQKALSGICGITAHEFWHVWNVKRLRPEALWTYKYDELPYTEQHWFTEGVTNYYADLLMIRAGLIDEENFLGRMARVISTVENSYPATQISPAQSSYDSWLDTSPYKDPKARISYYTLGNRMGLLLDLAIQKETNGNMSLDSLFVRMYQKYYLLDKGVPEGGIQESLKELTGKDWDEFFRKYIYGTDKFPYKKYLSWMGLQLDRSETLSAGLNAMGLLNIQVSGQGWIVGSVRTGSDAYEAGISDGTLILQVEGANAISLEPDDAYPSLKKGQRISLKAFSDNQIREISFPYQGKNVPGTYKLSQDLKGKPDSRKRRFKWLGITEN
ncbi:MAG: hypothetical protein AAF824_06040 [Bacteroidota bacterium]